MLSIMKKDHNMHLRNSSTNDQFLVYFVKGPEIIVLAKAGWLSSTLSSINYMKISWLKLFLKKWTLAEISVILIMILFKKEIYLFFVVMHLTR